MSYLLKRIADYFVNEYDGDDKTAPKMELSVDELRYIASMNVDRCRAEDELRKLKNKRCTKTNADRIRAMSDEELAELLRETAEESGCNLFDCEDFEGKPSCKNYRCNECGAYLEWLQSEVEE